MAAKRPKTPEVVARHGWRDRPFSGKRVCETCSGWGTRFATVGTDAVITHSTCTECGGRGHK